MVRVGQAGEVVPQEAVVPQVVVIQRAPQVIQPARRLLATPQRIRRAVMSPPIQSASHNRGSTRPIITSGSTGFSSRSAAPAIRRNIGTHPATSGNAGILTSCSGLSGIEKGVTPALFRSRIAGKPIAREGSLPVRHSRLSARLSYKRWRRRILAIRFVNEAGNLL